MTVDQLRAALAGVPGDTPVVLNVGLNELANGRPATEARGRGFVTRDGCGYREPFDESGNCTFTEDDDRLEYVFSIRSSSTQETP